MASRMEKYYNNSSVNTRSVKNENLYKNIYENTEYSNIEGIATIEKTNEIDLAQIRELLKEREEKKKKSEVKREAPKVYTKPIYEEKNYDIRDVLVKAKDEHVSDDKNKAIKNIAVIFAGGSGQRMGQDIPKQFLTVQYFKKHQYQRCYE